MKLNWDARCSESIKKQRAEVEKRYEIRFGQTDIYCAKCGKTTGFPFDRHICQNTGLISLRKTKKSRLNASWRSGKA